LIPGAEPAFKKDDAGVNNASDTGPGAGSSGPGMHAGAAIRAGSRRLFMKLVAIGALVIGLATSGTPTSAAIIDLSTWTCAKFQAADKDDIGVILAWMDGYYRDESDPPVIDTEKFVANAKKLGEYCSKHPDTGIITAADELFAK
jgi:acid stress chaperone HdeB